MQLDPRKLLLRLVPDNDKKMDERDWCPPLDRRAALKILGVGAVSTAVGCGGGGNLTSTGATKTATTTSLGTSATATTVGTSITLTAMVAPSAATGSVTFYSGSTTLGSVTLSSGSATLTTSFTTAQTATLTAVYSGDGTYATSTSTAVTVTVTVASTGTTATTTALSTSSTAVTVGASVTLTARVTPTAASGTVTFYNGTTSIGTGTLSAGNATLATSFSAAGTEAITAVYAGNSTYAGSTSSVVSITVSASTASCGSGIAPVTEGPYWVADSASGYNRTDIRSDVGGTNTQTGTQFTLTLYVYDRKNSCAAMQNVQVDIWHCNAAGVYSGIKASTNGNGVDYTAQSWLRGYQLTDSTGKVAFTTVVPGWYQGRTTHIHIRFRSTYDSSSSGSTNTAQLFFDQTFIDTFDTTVSPYSSEGKNSVTNAGDSIYVGEGGTTLLSMSGSASAGYAASFSVYLPLGS